MNDTWLRVTDVNGVVVFDCVHNGCTWNFDWCAHAINEDASNVDGGSCETVNELVEVAAGVRVVNLNATVEGFFQPEFENFMAAD